jgi:predicted small metal-binding protein
MMFELCCRNVRFDCPGIVTGQTPDDVLRQAAEHASAVHRVPVTPELAAKVASQIREVPAPASKG